MLNLQPTYSVTDVRQLKLLSADSEETRMCWVAALRIAKVSDGTHYHIRYVICHTIHCDTALFIAKVMTPNIIFVS